MTDRPDEEAWTGAVLNNSAPAAGSRLRPDDFPNISRAWAYWNSLRTGRPMPSRADIDPAAIKPLLPYLLLIDVLRDPPDFRFRLIGTEIDRIVAGNYTGVCFSDLSHMRRGNKVWAEYERVVASGAPLCAGIDYVGAADYVRRLAHALFPLADDGRTVNVICTVVDLERRW
jgi:hypothetical protein